MKSRLLKIAIAMVLLMFVYATVVNALSFTATMTPSSTTVAESTEFTVVVKVSNLDVGANGISGLSGYLKYDTSVFEKITESSIEGMNGWNPTYNGENSGKITLTKTTFVKSDEQVFQVTFKTKDGVSGKTGEIKFTNIVATNVDSEISASDIATTITIGNVSANTANTTENTSNTNSGNSLTILTNTAKNNTANTANTANTVNVANTANVANNTSLNQAVSSYVNSSNTSSEENIPYTGVEDTVKVLIGAGIVVAMIFYIKFERVNREMK